MATVIESSDVFTAFWNDVLVAKFERFRNIMLDRPFVSQRCPAREASTGRPGARAVDVGCGWGDTAIELARKVGPARQRRSASTAATRFSRRAGATRRPRA